MPKLKDIPKLTKPIYACDVRLDHIDKWIAENPNVDINPDFQREHVWDEPKQIAYVEWLIRGGMSGRDIFWNCSDWMKTFGEPLVIVDGKQRLEAIRRFNANEIPVFGHTLDEYEDGRFFMACTLRFHVADLKTKTDVLKWYLDMNSGGVVHTKEEIEKVQALLAEQVE